MVAPFHGSYNDIIGSREISLSSQGGVLVLATWLVILQKEQTSGIIVTSDKLITQGQ
jgi:hypothetical protein